MCFITYWSTEQRTMTCRSATEPSKLPHPIYAWNVKLYRGRYRSLHNEMKPRSLATQNFSPKVEALCHLIPTQTSFH